MKRFTIKELAGTKPKQFMVWDWEHATCSGGMSKTMAESLVKSLNKTLNCLTSDTITPLDTNTRFNTVYKALLVRSKLGLTIEKLEHLEGLLVQDLQVSLRNLKITATEIEARSLLTVIGLNIVAQKFKNEEVLKQLTKTKEKSK